MDSACGIDIQLVPQYPVVSESVTLKLTGIIGTIRSFSWFKGPSTNAPDQILSYIPAANPPQTQGPQETQGPQYFSRASGSPDGSLQISHLLTTDQGNYTVIIQTDTAQQVTVNLPVYAPVTKPVISQSTNQAVESENITLTCNTTNAEKIIWSRVTGNLPSRVILSIDNRTVTFIRINRTDTGQYQCEAENPVSKDISDPYTLTNLKIQGPLTVNVGSNITLQCSADSLPEPTYQWLINGTYTNITDKTLRIQQARSQHNVTYTCMVNNSVTRRSDVTSVNVTVIDIGDHYNPDPIVGIICGSILGTILVICTVWLVYRRCVLPRKQAKQ
ncbi:hypothetical protein GDO86_012295, partial [Hymenochirus boettgeri]